MFVAIYSPGIDVSRRDDLIRLAESFSPSYELTAPDTAVLNARGLDRLHGSTRHLLDSIARQARDMNLNAQLAYAVNPDAAVYAARHIQGITIIQPGDELAVLGRLDVAALPLEPELLDTLDRWGIRQFSQLATLPDDSLTERFGPETARWLALARGRASRPITVHQTPASYDESTELEHPIELLEPLLFVLNRMIVDVCARLARASIAANEFHIELRLDGGTTHSRSFHLPVATTDATALLKIVQLDLEAHPATAPIMAIAVHAKPARRRELQNDLFQPPAPEPEKLEVTLARIRKLVGEGNVGCPVPLNTHRPDAFRIVAFQHCAVTACYGAATTGSGLFGSRLAIRLFRPALEARVEIAAGHPGHVSANGIRGKVIHRGGPWRGSGDWWNPIAWSRDEWDVALSDGALYRIFRTAGGWFIDGRYD